VQVSGDTGSADVLAKATNGVGGVSFSAGINMNSSSDTGINSRLSAVQAKTDSLTFTNAGEVDANIQSVNDTAITGTGVSGDEWGP
jgi:hypothetical protein